MKKMWIFLFAKVSLLLILLLNVNSAEHALVQTEYQDESFHRVYDTTKKTGLSNETLNFFFPPNTTSGVKPLEHWLKKYRPFNPFKAISCFSTVNPHNIFINHGSRTVTKIFRLFRNADYYVFALRKIII